MFVDYAKQCVAIMSMCSILCLLNDLSKFDLSELLGMLLGLFVQQNKLGPVSPCLKKISCCRSGQAQKFSSVLPFGHDKVSGCFIKMIPVWFVKWKKFMKTLDGNLM
jgi:hypothetical protein